jgi:uncharacterized RmlC-like cupin family protein
MHVITAAAHRVELPGIEFVGLASPSRGSAGLCTWRITVAPNLTSAAPHTLDQDEIFMVTDGSLQITPGGPVVGPGDAVIVPAGTPIQLVNQSASPARATVAIRAGFVARGADGTAIATPPWAV